MDLVMSFESLLNRKLFLAVGDPWELTAEPGGPPRQAVVKATDDDVERGHLLLEVDVPCDHRGTRYELFTAKARYEGASLACLLLQHGTAVANLYGIPRDKIPCDPFGDWWRGGLGIIGSLSTTASDGHTGCVVPLPGYPGERTDH